MAVRDNGQDGNGSVYPGGYAVYSNGSGTTVVSIGECGKYTYRFHDGEEMTCLQRADSVWMERSL